MKILGWFFLFCVGFIFLGAILPDKPKDKTTSSSSSYMTTNTSSLPGIKLLEKVSISKMEWRKGGFGSIPLVTLTIKNDNEQAIRDATVKCSFYGNSGTQLSEKAETLYEVFPPKKSKKVRDINMGFVNDQAARANCELLYVKE